MKNNSEILKEMEIARNSGEYKVASLEMFDILDKLKLSENLLGHLEYTEELLNDYMNEIVELRDCVPGLREYLLAVKAGDIVDNQSFEKENSFLIGLHMQLSGETAIDKLIRYAKENRIITVEDIFKIHGTLLHGTMSDKYDSRRDKNDKFVGRFDNGTRIIDYFPIDYKDIDKALMVMADLYNTRLDGKEFDNVLIQPFLVHGLFGALQVFYDGNTRIGRIMQHVLMWQLINERTEFNFELPPVYATRNYYPFRSFYRELISRLVKENNNEAWNDWFDFNLKRVEDQIYKSNGDISVLKRKIR